MLVLFCFMAASPTPKSVAVGLSAVAPDALGGIGSCRCYPSQNITKLKVTVNHELHLISLAEIF